ncbi:MAG: HDIG domain-containing metalloprotein, partial [Chloroflexota bacterium]
TEAIRQQVAADFDPVERTFVAGQIVVEEGSIMTAADIEALQKLGLLTVTPIERRNNALRTIAQSFMVSVIVMIVIGLYIARFAADLLEQPRFLMLAAGVYLLILLGARIIGIERGELYIYPTAAMSLLFVAIIGSEVAVVTTLGLAMMTGFMVGQRLDVAAMVATGGLIGILTLRRAERLNSYFFAGLMVSLANIVIIVIFNLTDSQIRLTENAPLFPNLIGFGLINGLLAAAAAMALMYLVTIMFNLPTGLRLVELSQPNHPVLQRLLRDAPGTYQHSLQVANLAEQATSAIGGNAELVRVAALYHDLGKSLNAPFFVENQADGVNPHDEMGDPYRSADIIISHVTEGNKLARQNRLPGRIRDFVLEHHGTTRVEYFYRQALSDAEDPDTVDPADFTYPGPTPQSRETAVMMLADSCESTVRARRPSSKQEIQDIVQGIIDARARDGQLDDSGLTTNDIKTIRTVFVDMLQAVFHPRINYPSGVSRPAPAPASPPTPERTKTIEINRVKADSQPTRPAPLNKTLVEEALKVVPDEQDDDDMSPLPNVPPLPRKTGETKATPDSTPQPEDGD